MGEPVEEWRAVPGFSRYEVSDHGRVRSFYNNRHVSTSPRILHPWPCNEYGHLAVIFHQDNLRIAKLVHRLVLEAFVGPCPEEMEARHVHERDPANNRLLNLCWGTKKENAEDRKSHGTRLLGENHPMSRVSDYEVTEIRRRLSLGEPQKLLAEEFGMGQPAISKIGSMQRRGESA